MEEAIEADLLTVAALSASKSESEAYKFEIHFWERLEHPLCDFFV